MATNHWIEATSDTAWVCTGCGKLFSVTRTRRHSGWAGSTDTTRTRNLVRANAERHALACKGA